MSRMHKWDIISCYKLPYFFIDPSKSNTFNWTDFFNSDRFFNTTCFYKGILTLIYLKKHSLCLSHFCTHRKIKKPEFSMFWGGKGWPMFWGGKGWLIISWKRVNIGKTDLRKNAYSIHQPYQIVLGKFVCKEVSSLFL